MSAKKDCESFWDHLDVLREAILKCLAVAVVFTVVVFCFKEQVFAIILAPRNSDFITYRWLADLSGLMELPGSETFDVKLINTGLAQQFMIHVRVAFAVGILLASPYIIYQLFRFVSPALYADERRYATRAVGGAYIMFMMGVAVSYMLVFPLTFRFLGTYQVDGGVENMINLQSYISTLLTMSLSMGVVFEIPVLCRLFARMGFLSAAFMKKYRRHAVVIILIVAAVITPTSDVFTLMVVALPMYVLYEVSILGVRRVERTNCGAVGAATQN